MLITIYLLCIADAQTQPDYDMQEELMATNGSSII